MAVAHDAVSESHTGTTGVSGVTSFNWNHAGGASARSALVFTHAYGANPVTSVTYGTVSMTAVPYTAYDSDTEPGFVQAWFLDNCGTGTKNIVVNRTNNAVTTYATCMTQTAARPTEVYLAGVKTRSGSGSEQTAASSSNTGVATNFQTMALTDGFSGADTDSIRYMAVHHGGNSVIAAGTNTTTNGTSASIDFGVYVFFTLRETSPSQGSKTIGLTSAISDDLAVIGLAVREKPAIAGSFTANAVIKKTDNLGSTTANAVIKATITVGGSDTETAEPADASGNAFGRTISFVELAQSFPLKLGELQSVTYSVIKTGSPTDNVVVELQTNSGTDTPSGTVVATVETVASSAIATTYGPGSVRVAATSIPISTPGMYWLVFRRSGSLNDTDIYQLEICQPFTYSGGKHASYSSGSWVASSTWDAYFAATSKTGILLDAVLTIPSTTYEFTGNYRKEVVTDSPVAYWRLGESSGTNANDEIGANDGTYTGTVTLGVTDTALVNDADTAAEFGSADYVSVPYASALTPVTNFSLEIWCNLAPGQSGFKTLFGRSASNGMWVVFWDPNTNYIWLDKNVGGHECRTPALTTGEWHHIVVTYGSTSGTGKIYVDGADVTTGTVGVTFAADTTDLYIGSEEGGYNWIGWLDEPAIYGSVLSSTRVAAHYEAGIWGAPKADAVIFATISGAAQTFTANAVIRKTGVEPAVQPKADAIVLATQETGKVFAAEAVIQKTYEPTFAANAVIKATISAGKTFTANAVIATLVLFDNFNRSTSTGDLGTSSDGTSRWTYYDGNRNSDVNGSEAVFRGVPYQRLAGYPNVNRGIVQFDYFVPASPSTYDAEYWFKSGTTGFSQVLMFGSTYGIFVGSSLEMDYTPLGETWYTVKFGVGQTGDTVSAKWWKRGDAEPGWMASGPADGGSHSSQNTEPSLRVDTNSPDSARIDNFYIWATAKEMSRYNSIDANAVIRRTYEPTFASDAIVLKTQETGKTFAVEAAIAHLVFEDTFTRTVASGWGGVWRERNISFAAHSDPGSVDGSKAVQPPKEGTYTAQAHYGMPMLHAGIAQFDWWAHTTLPTWAGSGWISFGHYARRVLLFNNGSPTYSWDIQNWGSDTGPLSWTPPETGVFYTVKFSISDVQGTPVYLKIWKTGDPEPGWQYAGTQWVDSPPMRRDYYFEVDSVDAGSAYIDNIRIWTSSLWSQLTFLTADAIVFATQETGKTFTADAIILGTVSGAAQTFTANAAIATLIFEDTFTRTVSEGWGGVWRPQTKAGNPSGWLAADVDGSAASFVWDGVHDPSLHAIGIPLIRSGIIKFDFKAVDLTQPFSFWANTLFRDRLSIEQYSSTQLLASSYNEGYIFTASEGTWYTLLLHNAVGTGTTQGRVWETGQPEPSAWSWSGNGRNSLSPLGSDDEALYAYSGTTETVVWFDNLQIWTSETFVLWTNFYVDAFITPPTVTGFFYADAISLRTQTLSFLIGDAVDPGGAWITTGQVTVPGSFSADAIILAAIPGSATADAILLAPRASATTADAVIKATPAQTPWTVDAVVLRASSASFAANAIIKRSQTGTFAANAIEKVTFPRTGDLSVAAHASPAFNGDTATVRARGASFIYTGYYIQLSYYFMGATLAIYRDGGSQLATTVIYSPFIGDWQIRFEVWGDPSNVQLRARAWRTGSGSPDWLTATDGYGYPRDDTTQSVSAVIDWVRGAPTLSTDATIKRTQTGSFAANAVIRREQTGSFVANAIVTKLSAFATTADAVVQASISSAFSTGATILAPQTGSFSASAITASSAADSFLLDSAILSTPIFAASIWSIVLRPVTASLTSDSVVFKSTVTSFVADAVVRATAMSVLTANASIRRTSESTLTTDAIVASSTTGSFGVWAVKAGIFSLEAWLAGRFPVDAFIISGKTGFFNLEAWIAGPYYFDFATNAVLLKSQVGVFNADSIKGRTASGITLLDSVVLAGKTGSFAASSVIRTLTSGSLKADAIRLASSSSVISSDAIKLASATSTFACAALIRASISSSSLIDAVILRPVTTSFSSDSVVLKPTVTSFAADAVVRRMASGPLSVDAIIRRAGAASLTTDAIIARLASGALAADAILSRTGTGVAATDAVIFRAQSGSTTVEAWISGWFPVEAWLAGRFSLDAFVQTATSGAFIVSADIYRADLTGSFVVDAVKVESFAGDFTLASTILRPAAGSTTADATILRTTSGQFTSDALLSAMASSSFTAQALIKVIASSTLSIDAIISSAATRTFTSDAALARTSTSDLSLDAITSVLEASFFSADAAITSSISSSFAVDAVVRTTASGSWKIDAAILQTRNAALTTDAIVASSPTGSFTVTAVKAGIFTLEAWLAGAFSLDAFFLSGTSGYINVSAWIAGPYYASFVADATIVRPASGSLSLDAVVGSQTAASATLDATIFVTQTGSFSGDAVIRGSTSATVAVDAVILRSVTNTLTTDAIVARASTGSLDVDAFIVSPSAGVGSFSADAVLTTTSINGLWTDAVIQSESVHSLVVAAVTGRTATGALAADAVIRALTAGSLYASAVVLRRDVAVSPATADAIVSRTATGSLTANAWIYGSGVGAFSANAIVKRTASATITASAVVAGTASSVFTASALLKTVAQASFEAQAVLGATRMVGFATDAVLLSPRTSTFTANAEIVLAAAGGSFAADAILSRTASGSCTAAATVLFTSAGSFTADALVRSLEVGSFTADANIVGGAVTSFTVNAVLSAPGTGYATVDASISERIISEIEATFSARTIAGSLSAATIEASFSARTIASTTTTSWSHTRRGTITADAVIGA